MSVPLGIYISVPFCRAKCTYCNFASGVFGVERMERYVECLCREIRRAREFWAGGGVEVPHPVDTVFFGGGTPSLLSAGQFERIFVVLRGQFDVESGAEVTLECAPGQLTGQTLDQLLRQGMNRVSFGVQSFVDREAAAVGRLHTRKVCLEEIARMRASALPEINVDLIVGLPHQTRQSWRESVDVALDTGVPHVSVYMLEVDEDSRLGKEVLADGSKYSAGAVPSEDVTADWYAEACGWLEAAGVRQYEISNFARPGHECRHNVKYWRRDPYVGFGLDAHSMLRTPDGAVRRANPTDLDTYLTETGHGTSENDDLEDIRRGHGYLPVLSDLRKTVDLTLEVISPQKAFEEAMFLGLRMNQGVDLEALRVEFGDSLVRGAMEAMADVEEAGLVERRGVQLRLTERGRIVSNEVFCRLLVEVAVR